MRRNICLSPQIDEFIPGRVAEVSVFLKRSECSDEATPVRVLSASRRGVPEGKDGYKVKIRAAVGRSSLTGIYYR